MRLSLRWQEALLLVSGYTLLALQPSWMPNVGLFALHGLLVLLLGWMAGQRLFGSGYTAFERFGGGVLTWASSLSLVHTAAYYASIPLTTLNTTLLEAVIAAVVFAIPPLPETSPTNAPVAPVALHQRFLGLLAGAVGIGSAAFLFRAALLHPATVSIRTPWPLLPNGVFLFFALCFASGLVAAHVTRSVQTTWLAAVSWFTISALPALLYPLGYGFDGFIHRASQELLLRTGTLTPKPLYYIGQYVWTVWLSRWTELPLTIIDTWLVPASIGVVIFAFVGLLRRSSPSLRWAPWPLLLLLPLGAFVTTTPQTWSYLLGFSALLIALWPGLQGRAWIFPLLISLWAGLVHPLGGLPFASIVWALGIGALPIFKRYAVPVRIIGFIGALLLIPLAFWAQSRLGNTPIRWSWDWLRWEVLRTSFADLLLAPRQTLTLWLDGAEWARTAVSLGGILVGAWLCLRPKNPHDRLLAGTGIGLLFTQFVLERAATFSFLISYERGNYTERLGVLSALFLAIPVSMWLSQRLALLRGRSGFLWASMCLLITAVWTVRVYDALPRHDAAQASSGWSVGTADKDAVRWIHDQAGTRQYAVLANQSVSAAALERYGFARYHEEIFYYPLPTGGPLYQVFLEAASLKATTSTIEQAAALTKSEVVYVVINNYWWDAERVRAHLASFADRSLSFMGDQVWVYEFSVPKAAEATPSPTERLP
mgnify:CR=1 FL=1